MCTLRKSSTCKEMFMCNSSRFNYAQKLAITCAKLANYLRCMTRVLKKIKAISHILPNKMRLRLSFQMLAKVLNKRSPAHEVGGSDSTRTATA